MITGKEFIEGSYNATSLISLLKSVNYEQLLSTKTNDGYSIWNISIHVHYYKKLFIARYFCNELLFKWDSGGEPFVKTLEILDDIEWENTINEMIQTHKEASNIIKEFPESRLEEKFHYFSCSWGELIGWIITHDTYHIAQIRNMGII